MTALLVLTAASTFALIAALAYAVIGYRSTVRDHRRRDTPPRDRPPTLGRGPKR